MAADAARDLVLALVHRRAPTATVCPSEVARALSAARGGTPAWRDLMPEVHAAVDRLVVEEAVRLSWRGVPLAARAGAYRLHRAPSHGG